MTELQEQRAKTILLERKTCNENYMIDLLLDFWEETNRWYIQRKSNITKIFWRRNAEEGTWDCKVFDQKINEFRKFSTVPIEEKTLHELFFEISEIEPQQIMNSEEDIKMLGFEMKVDKEIMVIGIPQD